MACSPRSGRSSRFIPFFLIAFWSTATVSAPDQSAPPPPTQVHSFHLDVPRQRAFPLFTALGERVWAPGWEPVMLSGKEERGSAFRTRNHHGQETTWIVTEYRPAEGRVSYARLAQDSNIGLVDVICTESPDGGTDVSVRYTLTGVSAQGQQFVREFLDHGHYVRMIEEWRAALAAALGGSPKPAG